MMSFPISKFSWSDRLFGVNKKTFRDVQVHSERLMSKVNNFLTAEMVRSGLAQDGV